jgi:MFS family permease
MSFRAYFKVNKAIQILLGYLFLANGGASLFAPVMAIFIMGNIQGANIATAGFAIAIYSIVKSIVQIPTAKRIDQKKGEKDDFYVMMTGALCGTLFIFSLIFISEVWQLYILEILSGIADGLLMAAYYGIFSRHVDVDSQGFEWSLFSVWGLTISTAIGGAVGGLLIKSFGFITVFLAAGTLCALATILLFLLYPYLDGIRKKILPPFPVD